MKELSLNILDVAENSVKAGATLTQILIEETGNVMTISIVDDGCGMSDEIVKSVTDPFYTTRTTRSVGLGVPLFKLAAEQTGGNLTVESKTADADTCRSDWHGSEKADGSVSSTGTIVVASFFKDHLDFTPLGDVVSSITTLIQGHPDTDFIFSHKTDGKEVLLDTRELRSVLGDDVSLAEYEIIKWIEEYLKEQYAE